MRKALVLLVAAAGLVSASVASAADLKGWGVVVLPGKGGSISPVAAAMSRAGASVVSPGTSWPGTYVTYDQALNEVGRAVAAVRARGAKRIAIVGYSIGANIGLGYAAQRGGVDAFIAVAPGHTPDAFISMTGESLARAKAAVAAGHGNEMGTYTDVNQGRASPVRATAAGYASFFDPSGPALISRNSGAGGARVLWVVGTSDVNAQRLTSGGTTISVPGGHGATPAAGAAQAAAWLATQ